jgi:hypothetical protein
MPCYLVPPGVRFNDSLFTDPVQLAGWHPPACAGIVAILVRNPHWAPKPLQPLYFGEFGNDAARGMNLPAGARRGDLLVPVLPMPYSVAAQRGDLLVSVLPMPYSTAAQRSALCNELIAAYNPACQTNGTVGSTAELARKVTDLEARQHEQSQQILSLLAHLGKLFEPQPVGPRRPIGFLPPQQPGPAGTPATESGS